MMPRGDRGVTSAGLSLTLNPLRALPASKRDRHRLAEAIVHTPGEGAGQATESPAGYDAGVIPLSVKPAKA